jgi:hypothetical protein
MKLPKNVSLSRKVRTLGLKTGTKKKNCAGIENPSPNLLSSGYHCLRSFLSISFLCLSPWITIYYCQVWAKIRKIFPELLATPTRSGLRPSLEPPCSPLLSMFSWTSFTAPQHKLLVTALLLEKGGGRDLLHSVVEEPCQAGGLSNPN